MRFDVALHALRLVKSRSQAAAAVQAGHALLNGAEARPSHAVRVGDRITLAAALGGRTLEVLALPTRPLSRDAARDCWRELGAI